ncbi:MAG: T9SS type A sorting domain-containing protein [Bacteroidales bacterium]|nr:T9SS type A sorting domain-containing protein [Bacteroidales bacterium]
MELLIQGNSAYVHRMVNGSHLSKTINSKRFYFSGDSCWNLPIEDGCISRDEYIKGLGGPYFFCSGGISCYNEVYVRPVYYKKGTSTWGTPLTITNIYSQGQNDEILIFPNPTNHQLSISNLQKITNYTILDISGKLILSGTINVDENINIKSLTNGIYIVKVSESGRILISQVFIKK